MGEDGARGKDGLGHGGITCVFLVYIDNGMSCVLIRSALMRQF